MGLANRLVPEGTTRAHAVALADDIAKFPQTCLRADRLSALRQWDLSEEEAIANEMRGGLDVIASGETLSGATRFASGAGATAVSRAKAVSSPLQCEEEGLRTIIKMLYPPGPHSSTNCAGDFSSD
jgi:hypothetical protein